MSTPPRRTVAAWLSPDEIAALTRPSLWRGVRSVLLSWGLIALSFVLLAAFPRNPLAWLVALVVLGGRQLALSILMHEAAHGALAPNRAVNDALGTWLCAAPVWLRLHDYRAHHARHHSRTSLDDDPDLDLARPFPVTRGSLARKILRDFSGIAGLRRVVALLAMDLGVLSYTASTGAKPIRPRPPVGVMARSLVTHFGPVLLTNLALFGVLTALGHGWLYGVWVLAWLTTFSVFVRVRAIAEHAVTETTTDPLRNTRTTRANLLARLTVAPHHVNYHLEHHLLPAVPHDKLPELHALLVARGAWAEAISADGYLEVLRLASTPAVTPSSAG